MDVPEFPSRDGPQRLVAAATKQSKHRQKVRLEPGHSPLDWARLKSSGKDLRGVSQLAKYTLEELKLHNTPEDAWTAIQGKIYNITPYLHFHPGGVKDLMRVAGKDGTRLFMLTHSWVNTDFMLDACMVGFLVSN
ncbi:cytochrome b5-like heme/steroid binding domain-containing protein [Spinellus fusiger]|nr:cytochrome b5-like heme/steroid binding domain-containing protein [Spinellus fusiger]